MPNGELVDGQLNGKGSLYLHRRTFTGDVLGAFEEAQKCAGQEFYIVGDYGNTPQIPNLELYDAVSPYNMYQPVEDVGDGFTTYVDSQYQGWKLLADEFDLTFIPVVLPGFDNTEANWAPDGMPVLKRTPDRYRRLCEIARSYMDPEQPMALVTSFNEWPRLDSAIYPDTSGIMVNDVYDATNNYHYGSCCLVNRGRFMSDNRIPADKQRMDLAPREQRFGKGDKLDLPDRIWVNPVTVESYDRHRGFYHIKSPHNKKRYLVVHEGGYKVVEDGHANWSYSHGNNCRFEEVKVIEN